jgi:hypothetical protein
MPEKQEQEQSLVFDPTLINSDSSGKTEEQEQNQEKLNLFKDPIFEEDKSESEKLDKEKELEDKGAPNPDNIKDEDKKSSEEESVFSVVLGQELMDGGILSSFDKEAIAKIEKEDGRGAAMKALLETQAKATTKEIKASYDSEYQEYLDMRKGGVSQEDSTHIQKLEGFANSVKDIDLKGEDENSVQARKDILVLDLRLTTSFSEERIQRDVNKAYDEGTDLEDIDEAKGRVDSYIVKEKQRIIDDAQTATKSRNDAQKKQVDDLNSYVDKTEEYFKGEKVTPQVKESMKKLLSNPVKLTNGNVTSELWAERDKDPVSFDSKIAYLKAIGYFDGKPLDKFIKNATTKATSNLDSMLSDNAGRTFMKSSGKSFSSNSGDKKDFLDF